MLKMDKQLENDIKDRIKQVLKFKAKRIQIKNKIINPSRQRFLNIHHDVIKQGYYMRLPITYDNDDFTNYLQSCLELLPDNDGCFIITGTTGVGKTTLINRLSSKHMKINNFYNFNHYNKNINESVSYYFGGLQMLQNNNNVLIDRSPLDNIVFYLYSFIREKDIEPVLIPRLIYDILKESHLDVALERLKGIPHKCVVIINSNLNTLKRNIKKRAVVEGAISQYMFVHKDARYLLLQNIIFSTIAMLMDYPIIDVGILSKINKNNEYETLYNIVSLMYNRSGEPVYGTELESFKFEDDIDHHKILALCRR